MSRKKEWFKWTVELQAHRDVVEDGLDFTDDNVHQMLEERFPLAMGSHFRAKVLKRPDRKEVRQAQGYSS